MFRHIFDGLEARYAKELAVIRTQYPSVSPTHITNNYPTEPIISL